VIVRTRTKIFLAGLIQRAVMAVRRLFGAGPVVVCRRRNLVWRLDLREGIDFAIYLLGAFEATTIAAYQRLLRDGFVAIDVGANIGALTLPLAASVGASGLVIAAEPTRYAYDKLVDQISLNADLKSRIRARQVMLMGRADIALPSALPSSWPLSRTDGAHEDHLGISKDTQGTIVMTLDALIKAEGVQRIDLIKLDVDGYEIEVLRGASYVLNEFAPAIIFEHAPYTLVEKGYEPEELLAILRRAGYRFYHLNGKPFEGARIPDVPVGGGINVLALHR